MLNQRLPFPKDSTEFQFVLADAAPRYFDVSVQRTTHGCSDALLVLIKDTTSVRNYYYLEKISLLKSSLLASASHEFRNPLNGIIGMLELLEDHRSELSKTQSEQLPCSACLEVRRRLESELEYLSVSKSSSKLLLTLVNDLLVHERCFSDKN